MILAKSMWKLEENRYLASTIQFNSIQYGLALLVTAIVYPRNQWTFWKFNVEYTSTYNIRHWSFLCVFFFFPIILITSQKLPFQMNWFHYSTKFFCSLIVFEVKSNDRNAWTVDVKFSQISRISRKKRQKLYKYPVNLHS